MPLARPRHIILVPKEPHKIQFTLIIDMDFFSGAINLNIPFDIIILDILLNQLSLPFKAKLGKVSIDLFNRSVGFVFMVTFIEVLVKIFYHLLVLIRTFALYSLV